MLTKARYEKCFWLIEIESRTRTFMKITSLILKNNRVQIFIDDKYAFSATQNFVVDHRLFRDLELSETEFEEIKRKAQYSIVQYKLFEYASRLSHSPRELTQKVEKYCQKRFEFSPDEEFFKQAFKRLDELHLYDIKVVINILTQRYIARSKGKNYIYSKLLSKGFAKADFDEALKSLDSKKLDEKLERLLEKKYNALSKKEFKDKFALKQKLYQFGMSKGYGFAEIKSVVEKLVNNN
jgi:regulatory protein